MPRSVVSRVLLTAVYMSFISQSHVVCPPILGYGYIGASTDTTQLSGQTPDKEVEIKNITFYVSGYTETNMTGMLSPPTVWCFSVATDINSNVFYFYFLIWSLFRQLCCVGSGSNVAAALFSQVQSHQHYRQREGLQVAMLLTVYFILLLLAVTEAQIFS
jgi:hypothetical protein